MHYEERKPYQALVVVSFGGPESMADVMPYLERVTAGRQIPRERLLEVAQHYESFGGVSPLNEQNRSLIRALRPELEAHGLDLPIYWGNRNWHPFLNDAVREMHEDGIEKALAFVTAAYSSYSSCRQYREDIERARRAIGEGAPIIDKIRVFYNHPGFIQANADRIRSALSNVLEERRSRSWIAFSAHSIPQSMARNCAYEMQLQETSRLIAQELGHPRWRLVYQSRSGPPSQPWLEPDIGDFLQELKSAGVQDVVIAPIGFVSDHLEVVYDLDTEARQLAGQLGLNLVRAGTAGVHPAFVGMIRELIEERLEDRPPAYLGSLVPLPDTCPPGCCTI